MILPFNKISKNDANKAGGKWASLGEMTQAGIAIPPGFVVLAETFEEFIDSNNLRAEIQTILGKLDHNNVGSIEHASEKIQELIRSGLISEKIQKEIQKYTKTIKTDFVAVRSSATAEDGAEHAWAWQLDTYLNVPKTDIITKIQSCWASLFTPRALFYRSEKWLGDLHISVAVVVQSMVDAESAGVAFSVHPVTENTDEIVIEWSWWLGEAVVSGEVTPDSFVISKSSWEIISEHIAEKKKGIFRNTNGENEWRDIENRVQEKPILTKKELSVLSQLIIKIENHYGFPCDIEWAYTNGKIYILQARPITTLQGKTNNIKKDWVNIWSWSWSFLSCTDFASALSHEVKILWEAPFNNVRIFINNGKSACWVPQDQKDMLWKKVADFYGNKKELEKICQLFRESVDDFLKFFEKIKHKKIENKNYRKMWDLIVSEYRLHIIIKYIVDYLEPKLLDKFLPMLAEARVYAEPVFEKSEELMNNWIDEITQKSKIESRYISCCTREEFQSAIKNNKYPDVWILAQRYVRSVIESDGKSQKIHTGNEAENIFSELIDVAEDWSIHWSCAYPGKVQSIVRIIHDPTADNIFHQGDILVTGMTRPEYIHLAKKSAGIITDAGGILSHAAITARELKIPCIIGTKNATKILKDGDLVEVDAENGVVKILEKTQSEEWVKNVTREVTIFPAASVTKSFGKISKPFEIDFDYEHILFVWNTWYYRKSDYEKLKAILAQKIEQDTNYVRHIAKKQKEVWENLKKFVRKLAWAKVSSKNIESLVKEYDERMTEFYAFWWIAIPVGEILEIRVRKILENHSEIDFDELMFVREELELVQEKRLRNEIAIQCQKYKKYEYLPRILEQKLIQHAEQFGWINTSYHVGMGLSARDFFEKIQAENPEESRREMLEQRKREREILTKLKKHLSKEDQSIIESMQIIMYLRNYQKETVNECQYKSEIFLRKIAHAIWFKWNDFLAFSTTEIQEYIKNKVSKKVYLQKAKKRQREFVIEWVDADVSVYEEDLEKYIKKVAKNEPEQIKTIQWSPAYKWKTSGKVRVIHKKSDIELFIPGEILVTNMTSIDYVHIMGRASAIITNEGGITCHAAIFSRELRIPCIIGTKNATEILKTGDFVEVDAENWTIIRQN